MRIGLSNIGQGTQKKIFGCNFIKFLPRSKVNDKLVTCSKILKQNKKCILMTTDTLFCMSFVLCVIYKMYLSSVFMIIYIYIVSCFIQSFKRSGSKYFQRNTTLKTQHMCSFNVTQILKLYNFEFIFLSAHIYIYSL